MKYGLKSLILIFLLIVEGNFLFAQIEIEQALKFKNYSIDNGLLSNNVRDVIQDENGYLWIGTAFGLQRYDGSHFKNFLNIPGDSCSLGNNNIKDLELDQYGRIWIATIRGSIDVLDPKTNVFYHYLPSKSDSIPTPYYEALCIKDIGSHSMMIGTRFGLLEVQYFNDIRKTTFKRFDQLDGKHPVKMNRQILQLPNGDLWFLARDGLYRKRLNQLDIESIVLKNQKKELVSFRSGFFYSDKLYLSQKGGVVIISNPMAAKEKLEVKPLKFNEESMPITVRNITNYDNKIWISTDKGVWIKSLDNTSKATRLNKGLTDNGVPSLSTYKIQSIDDELLFWRTEQGISMYHPILQDFGHLEIKKNGLPIDINCITSAKPGMYWMGGSDGIQLITKHKDKWRVELDIPLQKLNNQVVRHMILSSEGDLYVATLDGFYKITRNGSDYKVKEYKSNDGFPNNSSTKKSYYLTEHKGKIWIASYRGLISFDKITNELKHHPAPTKMHLTHLQWDEDLKVFLIGCQLGIWTYDPALKKFDQLRFRDSKEPVLNGDRIKFVLAIGNGIYYGAGANGLYKMDYKIGKTKHYHYADGMVDVSLNNLWCSNKEIWMSHNSGMSKLDMHREQFSHYAMEEGIMSKNMITRSIYDCKDGQFAICGAYGIHLFNPANIKFQEVAYPLVISAIDINYESAINRLKGDEIELYAIDKRIDIHCAQLNYLNPNFYPLEFRLSGLQEEWRPIQKDGKISFTNLSPGNFKLSVRVSNQINQEPLSIDLIMYAPWWQRWWALLIWATLIIGIVGLIFYFKNRQSHLIAITKEKERNIFRQRTARDFHDEAGTKITKLSLLTAFLKMKKTEDSTEIDHAFDQLESNIQDLRTGMKDFIWVLDPDEDTLGKTVVRLRSMGNSIFEHTNVNFQLDYNSLTNEAFLLNSNQRRQLVLLLKEAMTNTAKYASAENANLDIVANTEGIQIIFVDDGIGFKINQVTKGYGIKNMKLRAEKIPAEIRMESVLKKGSQIKLHFQAKKI